MTKPWAVCIVALLAFFWLDGLGQNSRTLLRSKEATNKDNFGAAGAIRGDWAVVGASRQDSTASDLGSAYVFHKSDTGWVEYQKLEPPPDTKGIGYGIDCAIMDSIIIVSCPWPRVGDTANGYLFSYRLRDHQWEFHQWIRVDTLIPLASGLGIDIDLHEDVLVAGYSNDATHGLRSGSAFVYRFNPLLDTWRLETILRPDTSHMLSQFGYAVAATTNHIAVFSGHKAPGADHANAVYIFEYDQNQWQQKQLIPNPYPGSYQNGNGFGHSLAADNGNLLVGAGSEYRLNTKTGAVHWYVLDSLYRHKAIIYPPTVYQSSWFADVVAAYGNMAAIGAPATDGSRGRGYHLPSLSDTSRRQEFLSPLHPLSYAYGWSVHLHGNQMIVGGPGVSSVPRKGFAEIIEFCGLPVIGGNKDRYCRGDSVHLFAGCAQDSVVWFSGTDTLDTGNTITFEAMADDTIWIQLFDQQDSLRGYDTIHFRVIAPTSPVFSADTACHDEPVVFAVQGTPPSGARYYWDFDGDGLPDTSAVQASYQYDTSGTFPVRLSMLQEGCVVSSTGQAVVENCVGMESNLSNPLTIYPNPAHTQLTVELPSPNFEQLIIYNATGSRVYEEAMDNRQQVHLGIDWPAGIYFMVVRSQGRIWTEKITVHR